MSENIVVGGAGAAGLSLAWGLSRIGKRVTVLEPRPCPCERQSSGSRGGQSRLHPGAYYPMNPGVAKAVAKECSVFRAEAPDVVVPVEAFYHIPEWAKDKILSGWEAADIPFREAEGGRVHLRERFRRKHGITSYLLPDDTIDAARLRDFLEEGLQQTGGVLTCGAEIVAAEHEGNRIRAVITRTCQGQQRYACDWLVLAVGAGLRDALARVDPVANINGFFSTMACPVLRFDWNSAFSGAPAILQLFGTHEHQLLKNCSVIPVGASRRASVALSGGWLVDDPDNIRVDLKAQREELLSIMAEAFKMRKPENQEMSICCKALLADPSIKSREGDAAARLVTVLSSEQFGGSSNVLICSPGKLSGVFGLRDKVIEVISKGNRQRIAA